MKSIFRFFSVLILVLLFNASVRPVLAADPDFESIADRLVNTSLMVQPGEAVLITGNATEIPLMEALFVAVSRAGGQPFVQLNLPKANKRALMETPVEHLTAVPTANLAFSRVMDCQINVISIEDPALFADVPEDRLAMARKAGATLNPSFRILRTRNVSLGQSGGIPTKSFSESQGANHNEMVSMFWSSLDVDANEIAERGRKVTGMLKPGQAVTVTSTAGTNLTFQIDKLPARINAARTSDVINPFGAASVWLPAGEAYACVKSDTATGTLVVPRIQIRGISIENIRMTFQNGKLTGTTADKNADVLKKYLESTDDKGKLLSAVDFGLNAKSKPIGNYLSYEMAGVVSLVLGNNSWAGGDNGSDGSLTFFLPGTSVSAGNSQIVKNGVLEIPEAMASQK